VGGPLDEDGGIPLRGPRTIIHSYPDRVLLFVSNECSMYCRVRTRKRRVGDEHKNPPTEEVYRGIEYIAGHEDIRDVLISGGDSLLIPTKRLGEIIGTLREIRHLDLIRIGTRMPCVWPQKIIGGVELVEMLEKHTPRSSRDPQLYVNTRFNHPNEITEQSFQAVKTLQDLGFSDGISEDEKGGILTSAIGVGKVYVNDPIERVAGKRIRHNPSRR